MKHVEFPAAVLTVQGDCLTFVYCGRAVQACVLDEQFTTLPQLDGLTLLGAGLCWCAAF